MMLINCGNDDNVVVNNNNDSSGNDNNNDTPTTFEPQNIEIELVLKCFFIIREETTRYFSAIYTQDEFNDFINQSAMHYKNILIPSLFDNTFNFEEYQLLVAFDYISIYEQTLYITSVTEYEDKVIAVVENLESDFSYDLIAVPFIAVTVVKIPKTDKLVEFATSLLWNPYDD